MVDGMKILIDSILLILASEMGDKTQLLALVLASKYRAPWTIMAGILVATTLNHALAAWTGGWIAAHVDPVILARSLSAIFIAFAIWILIPDKDEEMPERQRFGAFVTTVILFFLAEMGDKTQLATIALAAKFGKPALVTLGTVMGMLIADGLAVFFGERLTKLIPMKWIRWIASALFALFGLAIGFGF
jgi:putative Ca2+/H+ antiporter (TMEM165/GDT1 family)